MAESQLVNHQVRFSAAMDGDYPMLIDGQLVEGDVPTFQCVDPYHDAPWGRVYAGQPSHLDAPVDAARRAFDTGEWSRTTAAGIWAIRRISAANPLEPTASACPASKETTCTSRPRSKV
jgi:hypothetical protein